MGEWVNTVGRTVRFLVAKALNFKIRENSRPGCVFCICVIRVCVFLRTVVSSPIASTECLCFGCAKDVNAKDATQKRKMRPAHGRVCPSDYEVMFWRTWINEPYNKKLALYLWQFCHSEVLKYLHITRFPLANFGVLWSKWAGVIMKMLKNLKFDAYWRTLMYMMNKVCNGKV